MDVSILLIFISTLVSKNFNKIGLFIYGSAECQIEMLFRAFDCNDSKEVEIDDLALMV